MTRLSLTALTFAGLLATGAALLAGAPSRAAPPTPTPAASTARPALTVSTTEPRREQLARRLPANGNVVPWQEASIGSESNGLRLAEVLVNVGDPVRAGQLLARFAADTVQADLAQARAGLQEARAAAAEAQANAERARALDATGAMSQQQVQQYATAAQTAQARVAAAQAAVDTQRLRLKHTEVRAPDAGVISARQATVGAVAGAGTELFRMLRRGRLEWRAEVTATDLPRLQPGGKALVSAASGAQVEGRVRMLAPTVDLQTRNALVYVDLPAHPDIRAGMFARGEFLLGQHEALTVPLSSLVVRDGFSHVFEVVADSRIAMRRVQTGQRVDGRVEIVEGLSPAARIVQQGGAFLNDGDLVRVAADAEQKQAPAPASKAPEASK
ncbi:MAG: efflux RND transporter periplasmic adaptor subunit [Proteobacteria bacterium]|nr:efflux RND transporter periplasmic adaptor subunit [Pseudomonadota bacterium]